jgi:5'-methylthioadenosine phosphorylase
MTNLPEAKLAREAEIALATLAMITDFDCWKTDEAAVTADSVIEHLHANVALAKNIIGRVIPRIPAEANWPEHRALDGAIMTDRALWPVDTAADLQVILERWL